MGHYRDSKADYQATFTIPSQLIVIFVHAAGFGAEHLKPVEAARLRGNAAFGWALLLGERSRELARRSARPQARAGRSSRLRARAWKRPHGAFVGSFKDVAREHKDSGREGIDALPARVEAVGLWQLMRSRPYSACGGALGAWGASGAPGALGAPGAPAAPPVVGAPAAGASKGSPHCGHFSALTSSHT